MEKLRAVIALQDPTETRALRRQLERLGHSVIGAAKDGPAALSLIHETEPDVLLLAHGLPGTNALDAVPAIQVLRPAQALPIVILSTHDDPALAEQAHAVGAAAFLIPPVSESELAWALTAAVSRSRDQQALRQLRTQATAALRAETLRQVTAALISTLDLEQVLDLILEQLAMVVTYDTAAVLLAQGPNLSVVAGRGFPDPTRIMRLEFDIEENVLFQQIC